MKVGQTPTLEGAMRSKLISSLFSIAIAVAFAGCHASVGAGVAAEAHAGDIGVFVKANTETSPISSIVQGIFFGPSKVLISNMGDPNIVLQILNSCGKSGVPLSQGDMYIIRSKGDCFGGDNIQLTIKAWRKTPNGLPEYVGCAFANYYVGTWHRAGSISISRVGGVGESCAQYYEITS